MLNRQVALLAFATLLLTAASQQQPEQSAGTPGQSAVKRQLAGSGSWKSQRNADDRGWQIQLKHMDDDTLSGRLSVVGSPSIEQARIEGQITGSDVYGVIVNHVGTQLGTFTGTIAANGGMSGTYTIADGDTGSWAWNDRIQPSATTITESDVARAYQEAADAASADAVTSDTQATETTDVVPSDE